MTQTREFVRMINHPRYEMMTKYPHTIRRIDNKRELMETRDSYGYLIVGLNDEDKLRHCKKHRLIAEQFLPNPDNLPQIDHINHNRSDNRIENLRWCDSSTNLYNRVSMNGRQFEFVDDLPDDAVVVDEYNNRQFENIYYSNNIFYFFNGIQYRKLKICEDKTRGLLYISAKDTSGNMCKIYYTKFKRQYDLL